MRVAQTADRTKIRPPELARQWGVGVHTVLDWIRSGQLRAIDVSRAPGVCRPRYLIDRSDLAAFEQRRLAGPPPKVPRPPRDPNVIKFI